MKTPTMAAHTSPLVNQSPRGTGATSAAPVAGAAAMTGVGVGVVSGGGLGGAYPHLTRPPPGSSTTTRGSRCGSPVVVVPHKQADRPITKSTAPQQAVGVPPAPISTPFNAAASTSKGTIPRGSERSNSRGSESERREAGHHDGASSNSAARPGGGGGGGVRRSLAAANGVAVVGDVQQTPPQQAPLVVTTRGVLGGDRPMAPVDAREATALTSSRSGSPRPPSEELGESGRSKRSNAPQSSGSCRDWRQQPRRPGKKPPRPPGPPPPYILEEQRKRREKAALQRAQQSPSNTAAPVSNRGATGGCGLSRGTMSSAQAGGSIAMGEGGGCDLSRGLDSARLTSSRGEEGVPSVSMGGESNDAAGGGGAEASPLPPEWQEFWDEEVEASYFYNFTTREAQWVPPDGF